MPAGVAGVYSVITYIPNIPWFNGWFNVRTEVVFDVSPPFHHDVYVNTIHTAQKYKVTA